MSERKERFLVWYRSEHSYQNCDWVSDSSSREGGSFKNAHCQEHWRTFLAAEDTLIGQIEAVRDRENKHLKSARLAVDMSRDATNARVFRDMARLHEASTKSLDQVLVKIKGEMS